MDGEGLTPEQKEHVYHAAMGAMVDLLTDHPPLRDLETDTLVTIFLAGVKAGVDALARVLQIAERDGLG